MNRSSLTQDQMNTLARDYATKLRVARQALPTVIGQGYVDSVPGHRVLRGSTMSVQPNQHLQPLQISRHFSLHSEQSNDPGAMQTLIAFAAADIAQAEDAVILLGSKAGAFLDKLHIKHQPAEVEKQEGLFHSDQKKVSQPILDSILDGIKQLREKAQSGDYYVIVSPDLYEEAYKNRQTAMDAPIYQIQPLLANQGFLFSEAAPSKSGVIFSLARGTIRLSIPMDTYVDTSLPDDDEGRPRFRVAEQLRLVIDDPDARVPLK